MRAAPDGTVRKWNEPAMPHYPTIPEKIHPELFTGLRPAPQGYGWPAGRTGWIAPAPPPGTSR